MREHDDFTSLDDDFDKNSHDGEGANASFDEKAHDCQADNADLDDEARDREARNAEFDEEADCRQAQDKKLDVERDMFDLVDRVCTNSRYVIAYAARIAELKALLCWTREDVEAFTATYVEEQANADLRSTANGPEQRRQQQFLLRFESRSRQDWQLGISRAAFTRMLQGKPVERFTLYILEETFRYHVNKRKSDADERQSD